MSRIFRNVYSIYNCTACTCSLHVLRASSRCLQFFHVTIPEPRWSSSSSSKEKPGEINIDGVLAKVNLRAKKYAGQNRVEKQIGYQWTIELSLKSQKRNFLSGSRYERSRFSLLIPQNQEDLSDGYLSPGDFEDDPEVSTSKPSYRPAVAKKDVKAIQSLNTRLSDLSIANLSEQEFWELLSDLLENYFVPSKSVQEELREFCHRKIPEWDGDTVLRICDWWHLMGILDITTFNLVLCELSSRSSLQTHQMVQIFYLISCYKEVPVDVSSVFVKEIEQSLDGLAWNELSCVCEGFFKCRPRVKSKLLALEVLGRIERLAAIPHSEYELVSVFELVTLLRFLSRSYERDFSALQRVADIIAPLIQSAAFVNVPHIAAAFAKLRCFHHRMFEAVTDRTMMSLRPDGNQQNHLRTKDVWLLLWAYGRLNYLPPEEGFIDSLVEQLRKSERESLQFPLIHVKTLLALCFLEVYPLDLIDKTFHRTFLSACEDLDYPAVYKHLVILDNSVAIERPEYDGNRLPKVFRERSLQVPHGTSPYTLELRSETRSLVETIARVVGGREFLKTTPILPHIRTPVDIEVDLSGQPIRDIPIDEHRLVIPQALPPDSQRLAVLFQTKHNYRFTPRKLLGVHVMKKRQLKRLGYKVAEVPYHHWQPLVHTPDKMRYIRRKINEAIGKKPGD